MKIKVGVSNRHVHLKEEHVIKLFGQELEKEKDLVQPGEFASTFYVTLKTEKSTIEKVRVLGPVRNYSQVEISMTDAYKLGLNPPIRSSGDLTLSSPITLIGPMGEVLLTEGCIIANRHIHINKEQRELMGLTDVNEVKVLVDGLKGGLLNHVYLKENDRFVLELHLDTDDANAFLIKNAQEVTIIK